MTRGWGPWLRVFRLPRSLDCYIWTKWNCGNQYICCCECVCVHACVHVCVCVHVHVCLHPLRHVPRLSILMNYSTIHKKNWTFYAHTRTRSRGVPGRPFASVFGCTHVNPPTHNTQQTQHTQAHIRTHSITPPHTQSHTYSFNTCLWKGWQESISP